MMIQLRIYTLASKEAAQKYANVHWKRHIESLKKYGITTHEVYVEISGQVPKRVFAIVSYEGTDLRSQNEKYMASADFKADMKGFQMSDIQGVEEILIESISFDSDVL